VRRPAALLALLLTAVLATTLAVPALVPGAAAPAQAAANVSVSGVDGAARASADGATTLRLSGSGFQSVAKGFGGIYVLFGWVSGSGWAPSQGGATGQTLRYVPDAETGANAGYQRFVAFPGSDTASEANGGLVAKDGTWSAELIVPGPVFTAQDRAGSPVEVNCLEVTCGVITIGAHGVANASNETFTPVEFVGAASDDAASGAGGRADGGAGSTDDTEDAEGTGDSATDDTTGGATDATGGAPDATGGQVAAGTPSPSASAEAGPATLGFDQATAVAGRVLSFAGQGFQPGEQVVVVLDDGAIAVGPLTAGTHGEIAGLMELPGDLRLGTHVLKVTAASSGKQPEVEVVVTRDPAEAEAQDALVASAAGAGAATTGAWGSGWSWGELAAGAGLLVLLLVVLSSAITATRRRRAARAAAAPAPATPQDRP
jgi:hypothetical protein